MSFLVDSFPSKLLLSSIEWPPQVKSMLQALHSPVRLLSSEIQWAELFQLSSLEVSSGELHAAGSGCALQLSSNWAPLQLRAAAPQHNSRAHHHRPIASSRDQTQSCRFLRKSTWFETRLGIYISATLISSIIIVGNFSLSRYNERV